MLLNFETMMLNADASEQGWHKSLEFKTASTQLTNQYLCVKHSSTFLQKLKTRCNQYNSSSQCTAILYFQLVNHKHWNFYKDIIQYVCVCQGNTYYILKSALSLVWTHIKCQWLLWKKIPPQGISIVTLISLFCHFTFKSVCTKYCHWLVVSV